MFCKYDLFVSWIKLEEKVVIMILVGMASFNISVIR